MKRFWANTGYDWCHVQSTSQNSNFDRLDTILKRLWNVEKSNAQKSNIFSKSFLRRNLKRFSFQPRMKRNVDCVKCTRERVLDDTNYSGSWSRLAPFPQNGPQKRNRQHFIKKSEKVVKRFSADVRFPIVSWNPRWHPEYVGISSKFRATSAQNLFISAQLFRMLKV